MYFVFLNILPYAMVQFACSSNCFSIYFPFVACSPVLASPHLITEGAIEHEASGVILVEAASEQLAMLLVYLFPMLTLTIFATIVELLAAAADLQFDSRLPECLAAGTTSNFAKKHGRKLTKPFGVLTNEVDFLFGKLVLPVDTPIVNMEQRLGKVNDLPPERQGFVLEIKLHPHAPLGDDISDHVFFGLVHKFRARTPVHWIFVLEQGDKLIKLRPRLRARGMRLCESLFTLALDKLADKV